MQFAWCLKVGLEASLNDPMVFPLHSYRVTLLAVNISVCWLGAEDATCDLSQDPVLTKGIIEEMMIE